MTEQVVKFIDGSIEAIHLQAGADGAYTQEQRVILKKLMKHRSDVIKRATAREKSPKGGGSKRRPAPAPPVEKSSSVDDHHATGQRPSNLAIVGRSATISTSTATSKDKKSQAETSSSNSDSSKECTKDEKKQSADHNFKSSHRSSVVSDTVTTSNVNKGHSGTVDVKKSRSVTSSIGQAPSIVSSASSISTDIDADASTSSETSGDMKHNNEMIIITPSNDKAEHVNSTYNTPEALTNVPSEKSDSVSSSSAQIHSDNQIGKESGTNGNEISESSGIKSNVTSDCQTASPFDAPDLPLDKGGNNNDDLDLYDLPPPPPDLQSGCIADSSDVDGEGYFNSYALPPAPDDEDSAMMESGRGDGGLGDSTALIGEESDESDSLDLPAAKAIRECSCDDNPSKFDFEGPFASSGSLQLPKGRQLDLRKGKKRDIETIHEALASSLALSSSSLSSSPVDLDQRERELRRLEQLQAYLGVTVTHADCEEMIGQFRHISQLSHEESHWALLSAMSLLADSLPHIKPSLEILAHRFKMANQCPSTGKDYQCEDAATLEGLVSQLDSVMNDSQQRGHYLADDLDDIIDIITTLSETLSKAKHCVSVAAIQNDNYAMIEVIARYYQMETRWLIHSCLLQLVEAICHIHPQAITEFLYSQLPLELVAEMQQHSNDDIRFLQVARSLGIVFMRGKASPHKLTLTMDLHFFIWLLGMIEGFSERCRHDDVEMLVALVCSYHLQHRDDPQNPVTEALKMAQGHALLECALSFLAKHDDPTRLLNSGLTPKLNSVVLLLTHLYDSSDTSDLLYTNDVDALIAIFQQVFRDLSTGESLHRQMLKLLYNFLRCYPDTMSIKNSVSTRLGPLLLDIKDKQGLARKILEHNKHIFEEL